MTIANQLIENTQALTEGELIVSGKIQATPGEKSTIEAFRVARKANHLLDEIQAMDDLEVLEVIGAVIIKQPRRVGSGWMVWPEGAVQDVTVSTAREVVEMIEGA